MPIKFLSSILRASERFLNSPLGKGLAIVYATWGLFFLFLWPRLLFWKNGDLVSGWIGIWGDWAGHLSFAAPFAYRPLSSWFTTHPLAYGENFSYHFVADAISGLLIRAGANVTTAFILPSIITTFLLLAALYFFYHQILRSTRQAFLALTIFLTSGGLGFWLYILDLSRKPTLNNILFPPQEYTYLPRFNIELVNSVTGMLIPQRSFLLGLPAVLLILITLSAWTKKNFRGVSPVKLALLGAVIGLIPLVHSHSYLVLVFLMFTLFLFTFRHWRQWVFIGAATLASTLFTYLSFFQGNVESSLYLWRPLWLAAQNPKYSGFLCFWLMNWGLFLPLAILGTAACKLYRNPLVTGGLVIFIIGNLISFQANIINNDRIIIWSYLLLSAPTASLLALLWRQGKTAKFIALLSLVIITASGFTDLWRITNTDRLQAVMLTKEDIAIAEKFRQLARPSDLVLTSTSHNHWVRTHTGSQTLLGYLGWLSNYGFHYQATYQDMRNMYQGGAKTARLLNKYHIKYVVVGLSELQEFNVNTNYFKQNHRLVLQTDHYSVYQIQQNSPNNTPGCQEPRL